MLFLEQEQSTEQVNCLTLKGDWTVHHFKVIKKALRPYRKSDAALSLSQIQNLDTVGTLLLLDTFGVEKVQQALQDLPQERVAMINTVIQALASQEKISAKSSPPAILTFLAEIGQKIIAGWHDFLRWNGFLGMVLLSFANSVPNHRKWRITSLVANLDHSGFQAVPIVMLLCFMVGAVVAFLGATVLENFGAQVFTVHLVTYSFLREFATLLTAILIAGRTASAYTAQLGSMKVNEEIDALKASGVDPMSVLVLPRVLSLVIAMPILTFLGMIAGITGGMLVSAVAMDISPRLFFDIINESVDVRHFLIGIGKAPFLAVVIAITGCLEGFKVSGSAESVGQHTTTSVVKCIFLVILLDALFAIFFMELDW